MHCEFDADESDRTPSLHALVRIASMMLTVRIGRRRCRCGGGGK